jgi:hypothetical protein
MMHPDIAMMNDRERIRELVAEAERRRLARQAQDAARAARSGPRRADEADEARGVPAPRARIPGRLGGRLRGWLRGLSRAWPREAR